MTAEQVKRRKKRRRERTVSDADLDTLFERVANLVPLSIACKALGIREEDLKRRLEDDPKLGQRLARKEQTTVEELVSRIREAKDKNTEWRGAAWLLERGYPDHFAARAPALNISQQNNTFTITIQQARQIEARRARLLPQIDKRLGIVSGDANGTGA